MNLMFTNPNTGKNEDFLYQWDRNVVMTVALKNVDTAEAVFWTDITKPGIRRSLTYTENGYTCTVPDVLLQEGVTLYISITYTKNEVERKTVHNPFRVQVIKQAMPEGWVSTDQPEYIAIDKAYAQAMETIAKLDSLIAVTSVNGKTGDVVLTSRDIAYEAEEEELTRITEKWLNDNPQITTSIQDGEIEFKKFHPALAEKLGNPNPLTIYAPYKEVAGDCTLLHYKNINMIIDFCGGGEAGLKRELSKRGYNRFDYAFISHYHGDHAFNLESFVNDPNFDFSNCQFFLPASPDYGKCTDYVIGSGMTITDYKNREEAVKAFLTSKGIAFRTPEQGETLTFDTGFSCNFYNVDSSKWEESYDETVPNNDAINSWSMALLFTHGNTRYLTSGDMNWLSLDELAKNIKVNLDLYKIEHHGQNRFAPPESWKNKCNPKYAFIEGLLEPNRISYSYILSNGYTSVYEERNNESGMIFTICLDKIVPVVGKTMEYIIDNLNDTFEIVPENSDLNNYTSAGSYTIPSDVVNTIANCPSIKGNYASLKVIVLWDKSRIIQIYINQFEIYIRRLMKEGFTPWEEFTFTSEVKKLVNNVYDFTDNPGLPNNTNLNDIIKPGSYYRQDGSITITNAPVEATGAFRLEVRRVNNGERYIQIVYRVAGEHFFMRAYTQTGWTQWYTYRATQKDPNERIEIKNNTNLNNLTEPGIYYRQDGSVAVTNAPSEATGAFRLEVKQINNGERYVQVLYRNTGESYFMRAYTSSGWESWYKHGGIAVQ